MPPSFGGGMPGGAQQVTPGLDIMKLLMMMKQGGNGPMSGGVGAVPPPSMHMPYSLPAGGGQNNGIYDLITRILGKTGNSV
jgi:hypothetical protein